MSALKNLPASGARFSAKSNFGNFRNKPTSGLTSIANKTTAIRSAFHKTNKTYGSIGAAIKDSQTPNSKTEDDKPSPAINQNFKPVVK